MGKVISWATEFRNLTTMSKVHLGKCLEWYSNWYYPEEGPITQNGQYWIVSGSETWFLDILRLQLPEILALAASSEGFWSFHLRKSGDPGLGTTELDE